MFSLCEHFGTGVVIINALRESSFEDDLAHVVIEIVTVFSARLSGSWCHRNKHVMEQLRSIDADACCNENN
jgi:putative resolvase